MARKPQPDRNVEPVAQRLRLRYAKRGRLRFSSHRDFQRALERAIRRAGVPIAFSAGFSPHPKISYANAAPTGTGSEAEYLEIGLTRVCDPSEVARAIDAAMPPDLDILEAVEARTNDFAERLEDVEVTRMYNQRLRTFDVRHAVLALEQQDGEDCAILRLVVRHTTPTVRPDDVLQALTSVGPLTTATPSRVTRWSQGPLTDDARDVSDPLAPDRV